MSNNSEDIRELITKICDCFELNNNSPTTDLNWINPFTLAVSVLLSAQTTDNAVNKATVDLFKIADSPAKMLALGLDNLKDHIKTIGLYNNKAKSIIKMSEILIVDYNSQLPCTRDELQKLPGIGRKSANVIMNILYNAPFIAVDTHVLRLTKRIGITEHNDPVKVERDLELYTDDKYKSNISNWLVLHGRYVCKAKKPECSKCCIQHLCRFNNK